MRVYLAMTQMYGFKPEELADVDILASYYYIRNCKPLAEGWRGARDFLCDSGLFTFVNTGVRVDLESYADEYADWVRDNNVREYLELDVDEIKGVGWTRKLRDRIEKRVGWQSIPVFHVVRGKEAYLQDCRDYNRVAVGFMLSEGLPNNLTEKYVPWFIDKAHEHDCRIHGLGFTKTSLLPKYAFDSVDSSTFSAGGRFGSYQYFDPVRKQIKQIARKAGTRMPSANALTIHNFHEWVKYQKYARHNIPIIW